MQEPTPQVMVQPQQLTCTHSYYRACIGMLRAQGIPKMCPLCRHQLGPGEDRLFDDALRMHIKVARMLETGLFTCPACPQSKLER